MGLLDEIKKKIWDEPSPEEIARRFIVRQKSVLSRQMQMVDDVKKLAENQFDPGKLSQRLSDVLSLYRRLGELGARLEQSDQNIKRLRTAMHESREWYIVESAKSNEKLMPLLEQRKKIRARFGLIDDHSERIKRIEKSARSSSCGLKKIRKIERLMRSIAIGQVLSLDDKFVKPAVEIEFDETDFDDCKRAAELGNVEAMYALGKHYQLKKDFDDNNLEAFNWYLKAALANFVPAINALTSWYDFGLVDEDDQRTAFGLYLKAARLGSVDAMCRAAQMALVFDTEESRALAFEWFNKAADAGEVEGIYMVGQCLTNGWGVEPDEAKALDWYLKAASENHIDAMTELGVIFLGKKNNEEAFDWFNKAAALVEESEISAFDRPLYYLARCHQAGLGVEKNLDKALEYFNLVSTRGVQYKYHAELRLAHMYFDGDGVIADENKAFELFEEAASNGIDEEILSDAMYMTGRCLYDGTGTAVDKSAAFDWFTKAALLGNVEAMVCAADMYFNGGYCEQNYRTAFLLYRRAAELGNVRAMYMLGQCYFAALGTGYVDQEEAFKWFDKAALNGNVEAMYMLGRYYDEGYGTCFDKRTAFDWYLKAALRKHIEAMYCVGRFYHSGEGIERDIDRAFKWSERAANAGNVEAMLQLGYIYYEDPEFKNERKAFRWFKKAAEGGSTKAMYMLGRCYEKGFGVGADRSEAEYWYHRSGTR